MEGLFEEFKQSSPILRTSRQTFWEARTLFTRILLQHHVPSYLKGNLYRLAGWTENDCPVAVPGNWISKAAQTTGSGQSAVKLWSYPGQLPPKLPNGKPLFLGLSHAGSPKSRQPSFVGSGHVLSPELNKLAGLQAGVVVGVLRSDRGALRVALVERENFKYQKYCQFNSKWTSSSVIGPDGTMVPSLETITKRELENLLKPAVVELFAPTCPEGTEVEPENEELPDEQNVEQKIMGTNSEIVRFDGTVICSQTAGRKEMNVFQTLVSDAAEARVRELESRNK